MPPARGHVTHSEHGKCAWIVCKCCVADKHRLVTPTAHWESVLILWISRVTTKQMHSLCRGQVWIMSALSKYLWISEGRAEKLPASVSHPCMWVWADIRQMVLVNVRAETETSSLPSCKTSVQLQWNSIWMPLLKSSFQLVRLLLLLT